LPTLSPLKNDPITIAPKGPANPVTMAYSGLVFSMVIWSLVPVYLKKLLAVLSPTEVSFSRFLGSGILMLFWVGLYQRRQLVRIFRLDLKLLLLCTVFGPLVAMVCLNFALVHVTVGTIAVFAALEPVCTYFMAVMIGQETWQAKRLLSILLALCGVSLVVLSRHEWGASYWISVCLAIVSPVVWAANSIIIKNLIRRHSSMVIIATSFVISSLFLIPTLSASYLPSLSHMGLALWMALLYCVLSNILGFTIWYWSLKYLSPSSVAASMYIIPIFSVTAGVVILGEPVSWLKITGIGSVLGGLYLVNVRYRK
jgi:O-acetylserine/cysteine efflux transporter